MHDVILYSLEQRRGILSQPCSYNIGKGGVWMEQILKAVVIGVLTVVIAALKENNGE